jgi:hypothetical protein
VEVDCTEVKQAARDPKGIKECEYTTYSYSHREYMLEGITCLCRVDQLDVP